MMRNATVRPDRGSVQRTALRPTDHRLVSWYTSFKLSLRDLVIMMADRGISVTHTTILRWVQRYLQEFEKRWRRFARSVGGSWRMDETYIQVHGQWVYLYRAVDKAGQTVDFFMQPRTVRCGK